MGERAGNLKLCVGIKASLSPIATTPKIYTAKEKSKNDNQDTVYRELYFSKLNLKKE